MTLIYLAFAWLFILLDYVSKAIAFVRHMNAKQTGRHARGRHRPDRVEQPRLVLVPGGNTHRRRQGMLTMPAYRPGQFEAAA